VVILFFLSPFAPLAAAARDELLAASLVMTPFVAGSGGGAEFGFRSAAVFSGEQLGGDPFADTRRAFAALEAEAVEDGLASAVTMTSWKCHRRGPRVPRSRVRPAIAWPRHRFREVGMLAQPAEDGWQRQACRGPREF